jgi:hypothetical protein
MHSRKFLVVIVLFIELPARAFFGLFEFCYGGRPMFDDVTLMRAKAEACRRLAAIAEDASLKALWLARADYWEKLAVLAAKPPHAQTET